MKKSLILIFLICAFFSYSTVRAEIIWQIGTREAGPGGANEYLDDVIYFPEYDYYVDTDSDPIYDPAMPGHLGTELPPPTSLQIATAFRINIHFELKKNFSDLILTFGKYGSENDILYCYTIDEEFNEYAYGLPSNEYKEHIFHLGSAKKGNHIITIEYAYGEPDNGHYIDYLLLEGNPLVCTSRLNTIDELKDEIELLSTSTNTKFKLNTILTYVEKSLDNDNNKVARSKMDYFIGKLVEHSNLKEKNSNRINLENANSLICGASNILIGIPLE